MGPINEYNVDVEQSGPAIRQDYVNNQPPFKGAPAAIPFVPVGDDMNPLVSAADCPYKYAELQFPDGHTQLAIVTPWSITGGPGLKLNVTFRQV